MMGHLLEISGLGFQAAICVFCALIYYRLGRVEKDVERIAERADIYETKVDRMEGRFETLRKVN